MDIPNNKSVKVDGMRLPEGFVSLHKIKVCREGRQYCCELTLSGRTIDGYCVKKVFDNESCRYNGAWSEQVADAIRLFEEKASRDVEERFQARVASQDVYQMCLGKAKYRTPEYAEKRCDEVMRRTGEDLNYYFCNYCSCYHLGHLPWWMKEEPVVTHVSVE